MIVITESDLGIACDSTGCTKQAYYVCMFKFTAPYARLYCPQHTAELLQSAATILKDGESLHDYIETEFLVKGNSIQ